METNAQWLRHKISLGWIAMLLVLTVMLAHMILLGIYAENDFAALKRDPGPGFLKYLMLVYCLYAVMPIYIYSVERKALRWVGVGVASLFFLFFVLHHLGHWVAGDRPGVLSHALEAALHVLGLWVVVNSVRWARIQSGAVA